MTIPPDPTADQLRDRSRELLLQGLSRVEVLLDEGRRDLARSALRLLLDRADPEVARTITERAAVAELAREAGWIPPLRPDVRYVPAGRVTIRHGETRTPDPRQRAADAAAAAYLADQPPAPTETSWRDAPSEDELDYDRAALTGLRGAACLGCRLERTPADRADRDGLCIECRESGLTREQAIERHCADIATANPGPRATDLLRRAWTRASRPSDRAVIAAWVARNPTLLAGAGSPQPDPASPDTRQAEVATPDPDAGPGASSREAGSVRGRSTASGPVRPTPPRASPGPGFRSAGTTRRGRPPQAPSPGS